MLLSALTTHSYLPTYLRYLLLMLDIYGCWFLNQNYYTTLLLHLA